MSFTYYNPVQIDFGNGSLQNIAHWIKERKALLITSKGFSERGVVQKIVNENSHIVEVIDTISPNPTINQLESLYGALDFNTFEVIVALGGGSVIDAAKALSIYFTTQTKQSFERIKSMLMNGEEFDDIIYKPIIAVPTTAGTGSEVTPWGTVWDTENKKKYSIHTNELWCEVAICDSNLTMSLPKELTIQTGLDALSHSLESIWNVNTNPLSFQYAKSAIIEITETLPFLVQKKSDENLREKMMLATLKSGLAFSNTKTALAHAMSYYMTLHKNIPHGIAVSITLPDIIRTALEDDKLERKLKACLGKYPLEKIEGLLHSLGVSTNYTDYNLLLEDFKQIRESLSQTSRAGNSIVDSEEVFEEIVKQF